MKNTKKPRDSRNLAQAESERLQHVDRVHEAALQGNCGPRGFMAWKEAEAEDTLDLFRRSDRLQLLAMDMSADLHLAYRIEMPVPRWPRNGELVVDKEATFHLVYRDEWRTLPPKGWEPVGILSPIDVFHPNTRPSLRGALCLGSLPAGVSPKNLILLSYLATSLQNVQLAEDDPEGVLNAEACEFFRCHPEYLPLTRTGLCEPWEPDGEN